MFFLIRTAFWLSIVVLLLPTGKVQQTPEAPQIATADAISAASAAVSDMRQFCSRQPDACSVGSQAVVAFGHKAQASAKMIYEFFTEKRDSEESKPETPVKAAAQAPDALAAVSQNTLTAGDRVAAWRGPQPRLERHARGTN